MTRGSGHVVAVGEPSVMSEVGIYRTIIGIRRIWRQTGGQLESAA